MKLWDKIKRLYFEKFGYTDTLVEMVASSQILKLCASGASNRQIADVLDIDIEVVIKEVRKWLYFSGWEKELEYNPLAAFRRVKSSMSDSRDTLILEWMARTECEVCERYLKIEEIIMKEWL